MRQYSRIPSPKNSLDLSNDFVRVTLYNADKEISSSFDANAVQLKDASPVPENCKRERE